MKARIILGDCMPHLEKMKDGQYQLLISDPPYGIGRDGSVKTTSKHGGRKAHDFKGWDAQVPEKKMFEQMFRVSQNQIIWGANYFTKFLPPSMGWIFWDKGQRICNSDGELAFTSFERALRVIEYNRVELLKEGTIHPTQKPKILYKNILKNYATAGDHILDTHGGGMSIVLACIDLGFDITIIEKDPDYFAAAKLRIQNYTRQLPLFTEPPIIEFIEP